MHQYQQQRKYKQSTSIFKTTTQETNHYIYLNTFGVFNDSFFMWRIKQKIIWKFFQIFIF